MSKIWFYLSSIILIIFIIICIISTSPKKNLISINNSSISNTPKELPIARIIIPRINIDNLIYNTNSKENTVEKNVMLLNGSILPNSNESIIFLAAHSGVGDIAYFDDLDKLNINDILIFQYKNYNYYYSINNKYEIAKDGDIELNKTSSNQLVLTTCSKTNKKKQLLINSNLIKKEEIT